MAKLIIDNSNPKKATGKIEGVVFAYTKLQSGDYKWQSTTEKEYSVDMIVDKATAKAYKKAFPKNSVKEIDTGDFESKYKFSPPYPKEDEQYVIKLKADTRLSTDIAEAGLKEGDEVPYEWSSRPKVFIPVDGGVKDVTLTTLVGNGSKGIVAFNVAKGNYGVFPKLTGILVEELVEYESNGPASAFGAVVGGLNADTSNVQQKAVESSDTGSKETSGDPWGEEEDPDSMIPF